MTRRGEKLLTKMQQTKSGWKARDLLSLYREYDFEIVDKKHFRYARHHDDPSKTLARFPRDGGAWESHVSDAVKLISEVLKNKEKNQ